MEARSWFDLGSRSCGGRLEAANSRRTSSTISAIPIDEVKDLETFSALRDISQYFPLL